MAELTQFALSRTVRVALLLSLALLALKLDVAQWAGFADGEALYLAYALHPQPAYLDHPGLVGLLGRLFVTQGSPNPAEVHLFAAVCATALPWFGAICARGLGASRQGALLCFFALAVLPAVNIGLFALTPHLPLAFAWLGCLSLCGVALRSEATSRLALVATLGAFTLAALATLSTASGAVLFLVLAMGFAARPARARWRTLAPYAGIFVAAILLWPLLHWETENGFPLLRHRLIDQANTAIPIRALLSLTVGQLVYFTPPGVFAAWWVFSRLRAERGRDAVRGLLWQTALVSLGVLSVAMLLSNHAEPHWLAPVYLTLALGLGVLGDYPVKLGGATLVTGVLITVLGWLWVRTPLPVRLLGEQARYDVSTDLIAWRQGEKALKEALIAARRSGLDPIFVGPHYIICAQVELILTGRARVGCATSPNDDYDRWFPRQYWQSARSVIYVSDSRFDDNPHPNFDDYVVRGVHRTDVRRGDQVVRSIRVTELERVRDVAMGPAGRR